MVKNLSPCENTYLIGHDEEIQRFLHAYNSGVLHHGWLIMGDEGIGKATFAYKIARFLLTAEGTQKYESLEISPDHPVMAQVIQQSHPDLKVLERDYTETDKKKLIKAINQGDEVDEEMKQSLKRSNVIKVEDVRDVVAFLMKKSFNDSWRVVIVDSVDDLNTASANALLKILEEPPLKSILLLISHNPGRVLPTIRSRCTKLMLSPLKTDEVAMLLRRYKPEIAEKDVQALAKISGGSIGRALKYAENDALLMYASIQKICYSGARGNGGMMVDLANEVAGDEDVWSLFSELVCRFIRQTFPEFNKKRELYAVYENVLKILDETERLNMDKKQAVLQILNELQSC